MIKTIQINLLLQSLITFLIIIVMLLRICRKISRNFTSHTIQPIVEPYLTTRKQQFQKYMPGTLKQSLDGFYSIEGGQAFAQRHPIIAMKQFISDKLYKISSIGVGTYKGSFDTFDDILQFNALIDSVLLGANMIDTCSNFREGRSELVIGSALRYLVEQKKYQRDQIMIASKAGYVRQKLTSDLAAEVVNQHCVHPIYLQQSLTKSLQNMKVKGLDIFYLNNFAESQLPEIGKQKFQQKLAKAFQFCEKQRQDKKIKYYGLSSWQSFRLMPNDPLHLNLKTIVKIAQKVGGPTHGFKFLQVPINVMMPEAFAEKNQQFGSLLQTAEALKINVVSNSPILSGSLINIPLPTNKLGCRSNGAKHLQLIRSIPSPSLVCSLIGHKTNRHTKKNLQVMNTPILSEQQWFELFIPKEQANEIQSETKETKEVKL